jgi:hypothetical protein
MNVQTACANPLVSMIGLQQGYRQPSMFVVSAPKPKIVTLKVAAGMLFAISEVIVDAGFISPYV